MKDVVIVVGGMHCVRCAKAVENALSSHKGVIAVTVNYSTEKAFVRFDETITNEKQIAKAIKVAGYYVVKDKATYKLQEYKTAKIRFIISAVLSIPFVVMMVGMLFGDKIPFKHILHNGWWQFVVASLVQFGIGYRFYVGAFASIKNKSASMDVLVSLGTTIAYVYSTYNLFSNIHSYYFEGCVFIITFINMGRFLELRSRIKTSDAITMLMNLSPKTVRLLQDGIEKEIPLEELKEGDVFIVRSGESIATDGEVIDGASAVDESMLTGESIPNYKNLGSKVFGGTVNTTGTLTVKAEKILKDTKLSEIIRLVESAQNSKATVQRVADKVSAVFVPAVILVAVVVFVVTLLITKNLSTAINSAVSVLVIACPCALGLATPTALMVGTGRSASLGVLIKSAETLENSATIKTIVFDKTGTLTQGKPSVTNYINYSNQENLDAVIYSIESKSTHPLAQAVCEKFKTQALEVEDFEEIIGHGVKAGISGKLYYIGSAEWIKSFGVDVPKDVESFRQDGQTVLTVMSEGVVLAIIAVSDKLKEGVKETLEQIKNLGIKTVLATGDNKITANAICRDLGIDEIYAEVKPDFKAKLVEDLKKEGKVAFVGDGINDSPALATADVGIAMGNGIDIAIETGDVVLLNGEFKSVLTAVKLAKATMNKIKTNLFWAFFYNAVAIPLASFGLLTPSLAGLCMAFSSVSVVTNSLLLYKKKI